MTASHIPASAKCAMCLAPATDRAACAVCGKTYYRCPSHGGLTGAKASLRSHAALYHPKGEVK